MSGRVARSVDDHDRAVAEYVLVFLHQIHRMVLLESWLRVGGWLRDPRFARGKVLVILSLLNEERHLRETVRRCRCGRDECERFPRILCPTA